MLHGAVEPDDFASSVLLAEAMILHNSECGRGIRVRAQGSGVHIFKTRAPSPKTPTLSF